ncbi:MAG: DUF3891 family protein [Actinomycetota bacterium]|nr:DUF3891 family protein [Actinomycetota bacterium]
MLIRQHDHGRGSGEFARHWGAEIYPETPTLYAIAEHDVGWQELDDDVRLNPETGKPYSFIDYPLEPKLRAYRHGLDHIEAEEPYAGYLCSLHYSSFVRDSEEPAAVEFREEEAGRRARIEGRLPEGWLKNSEYNFRLLQLCDDLSLFVCLNEPGENTFPWYRDGFRFREKRYAPVWQDRRTLSLSPNPFSGPLDLAIPYRQIERDGRLIEDGSFWLRVAC